MSNYYAQKATKPEGRLPTLEEVLSRKSTAPVDLFNFYIFMRDSAKFVDYLDLWLDIVQHTSLHRLYSQQQAESLKKMSYLNDDKKSNIINSGEDDVIKFLYSHYEQSIPSLDDLSKSRQQQQPESETFPQVNSQSQAISDGSNQERPVSGYTIQRTDLRISAERILYTYLVNGAEKEVTLPRILSTSARHAIEEENRDDPKVFDAISTYIFHAMEHDAFPYFLHMKALGNLIPSHCLMRLLAGIMSLFAGLWLGFSFIFLNYGRQERLWTILPFGLASYYLITYEFSLDPFLALMNYSETTFFNFMKMREPYIKKLLFQRSIWVLFLIVLATTLLTIVFVFVPGRRL